MKTPLKTVCIVIALLLSASCDKPKVSKQAHYLSSQGQVVNFPDDEKHVILNFWASWCGPCREEVAELNRLHARDDVVVVGVNVEHISKQHLMDIIQDFGIQYPILTEDPHQQFKLEPYPGIPATYILKPNGEWIAPLFGKQTEQTILKHMMS